MKFLCPNCKAKYQIADEKVAGRTLRMDCRRCGNNVTIRADMEAEEVDVAPVSEPNKSAPPSARASASATAVPKRPTGSMASATASRTSGSNVGPAPSASSRAARPIGPPSGSALGADFRRNVSMAPEAPKRTPLDQWHVAINDVPVGPMRRDEITKKIATGAITGESLCWREGFDDWRPLRDVTELAALLRRPAAEMPKPRSPGGLGARPLAPAARPVAGSRVSARSNVVSIGGRLGAVASLEPEFEEHEGTQEADEPTRVAGFDLHRFEEELAAKSKKVEPKVEAKAEPKLDPKPEPKLLERAARKSFPPPPADPVELREPSKRPAAPAAIPSKPIPAPAAAARSLPATLPIIASAPAPVGATNAFPVAVPVQPAPVAKQERRPGIPVGGWIAIAGAMAFGGVLAAMVGSRMLGEAPAPAIATTVPVVAPATAPTAPPVAEMVEPPPEVTVAPTEAPAAEVSELAAPTTPAAGGSTRPHREGTTPAATTSTPTAPPSGRFAAFQDEASSSGPAHIAVAARPPTGEDRPTGGQEELSADQLRAVIVRERPAVNRCWETELRRIGQAAEVRLDVDLTIGGSGTVTNVQTRGQTIGGLSECIERSVRRWRFPAVSGQTRTSFPLIFSGS